MIGYKDAPQDIHPSRMMDEFATEVDPKLRAAALDGADYMQRKYGVNMIATCIVRTTEENDKVSDRPKSSHLIQPGFYCRAIDWSIHHLAEEQAKDFCRYIISVWGHLFHCIVHGKGENRHIHMNINWQWKTKREVS